MTEELKVISLDANVVKVPIEPLGAITDEELTKRIHELFVKTAVEVSINQKTKCLTI